MQQQINQIASLYEAGNPAFLTAFRAIQARLSDEELWQLVQLISTHLENAVVRAEEANRFIQAA